MSTKGDLAQPIRNTIDVEAVIDKPDLQHEVLGRRDELAVRLDNGENMRANRVGGRVVRCHNESGELDLWTIEDFEATLLRAGAQFRTAARRVQLR
ncbi:hypothetical protein [Rhizobium leguminosarum]|uniref:hypothetical protein n=1 Tax=Rhizobium leguminosarum TaxID=384 RepID=UPI001031D736|nr:hypothetical protein [Rhizobium leguminosarum]TBF89126.1 hypothetical protein ELG82_36905 [Rhizobium leguminosarum]